MLLPAWVVALAAGIAVTVAGSRSLGLLALILSFGFAAWRFVRRRWVGGALAAALSVGIIAGLGAAPPPLAPLDDPEPEEREVLARVIRGPEEEDGGERRVRLWLALQEIAGHGSRGIVALTVVGRRVEAAPGDLVSFRAALHTPSGLANPGLPDGRVTAAAQGIDFFAALPSTSTLHIERRGWRFGPRRLAWQLREAMGAAITGSLPAPAAGLLLTVVLGVRSGVGTVVEDGFRAAGATHVLSVSGLHLAAVAALIVFFVRWSVGAIPVLALRLRPGRAAAIVALPAVWLYTLVTGEAVATERSALMAAVALGAILCGRSFHLPSSIALAALVLLVRSPLVLLDVSFQLSFASVIALGLLARRLGPKSRPRGTSVGRRVLGWLGRFGAATVAAGVVTAPLVAHHFGEVTFAAPLGNLVLVPLVELVVLPLGLGGALLGSAHPMLGRVPLTLAGWGARLALSSAELFRVWAPVLLVRSPTVLETAALMLAGAAFLAALTGRRLWGWLSGLGLTIALVSLVGREVARRSSESARVTFLDVGQGDAAVVEGPGGFVAVIDGGGSYDDSFDTGARVVEPYLRARGISHIDLVVLSHPHPDHLNGLFRVLGRFDVGALWTSGDDGRNPRYRALIALAKEHSVPTPVPGALRRDRLTLQPLGPWVGESIGAPPGTSVNDASLVVRLEYGGRGFLFPGDLEADGEGELVGEAAGGVAVLADVLKVPHHGSRTSSSDELIDAVRPSLAVISLGRHNRFGFPREEVLARYRRRGVTVLRTDEVGAVTVTIERDGAMSAECVRGCSRAGRRIGLHAGGRWE